MFDVSKSKLYQQIMEAAVSFFGLDQKSATEAEVHDALDGAEPLAKQLEQAKASGGGDAKKVADLEEKVNGFQAQLDKLAKEIEAKDARIAELQVEVTTAKADADKTLEALKGQHKKEISTLAGQVAALKAGTIQEHDEGGGDTIPATQKAGKAEVIALKDESLIKWVKGKQNVAN